MTRNVIVFDIWGDYAYFRRGYTTTSTISYPFPSRTTIAGIIAAILGLERDSYYEIFNKENSKIGLKIINPIKKTRINLNYINTKEGMLLSEIKKGKRTQVPAEFLKDVQYRIYVSLEDESLMKKLYGLLKNHKSVYTPCLGITECIANFKLVDEGFYSVDEEYGENIHIDTVIEKNKSNLVIEPKKKYGVIKSPGFFNSDRSVEGFIEYYFEEKGNSILLESANYYKIGEDNVILY